MITQLDHFVQQDSMVGLVCIQLIYNNDKNPIDFIFCDFNIAFEKIIGRKRDKLLGKTLSQTLPSLKNDWLKFTEQALYHKTYSTEVYFPMSLMWCKAFFQSQGDKIIIQLIDITTYKSQENEHNALISILEDLVIIVDNRYMIKNIIVEDEKYLFIPKDKAIGKKVTDVFKGDFGKEIISYIAKADSNNERQILEYPSILKGDKRWFRAYFSVGYNSNKEKYFIVSIIDITKFKEIEFQEKNIKEDLERFFSVNLDLLCIVDFSGKFIRVNKAWEDILGYSSEELEQTSFMDFVYTDDIPATLDAMNKLQKNEPILNFVNRYRTKEGTYRYIEWRSKPYGNLVYAAARDITSRLEIQYDLIEKEQNFRTFFESIDDMIFVFTYNGKILQVNNAVIEKLGLNKELVNIDIFSIYPEETRQDAEVIYDEMLKGERNFCYLSYQKKDGSLLDVQTSLWTGKWDNQDCIFALSKDLTKQQMAIESEMRYRAIVNNAPEIVAIIKDNKIAFINKAGIMSTEYEESDLVGADIYSLITNKSKEMLSNIQTENFNFKEDIEIQLIKKSGSVIDLIVRTTPIIYENEKATLAILIDISERKAMEEKIYRNEKILSAVALSIKELIVNTDYYLAISNCFALLGSATEVDSVYLYQNSYDEEGKGRTSPKVEWSNGISQVVDADFTHDPFDQLEDFIQPLEENKSFYKQVKDLKNDIVKGYFIDKGILSFLVFPLFIDGVFWGYLRFDCKHERKWMITELSTLGAFAHSLEKAIERSNMEEELEKSRKEAESANIAKSLFLANMSHEIRTPINGVLGVTELLTKGYLTDEQRQYIDILKASSDSLLSIINDILDLSKIESGSMTLSYSFFKLSKAVKEAIKIIEPISQAKGIPLIKDISDDTPEYIIGDQERLKQILINLISNAVKFTEKGSIAIKIKCLSKKNNACKLEFIIQDTGIGIPEENIKTIFEPFVQLDNTIRKKFGGTGLGLAICYKLVKLMNGTIWIESSLGIGTEVHFIISFKVEPEEDMIRKTMSNLKKQESINEIRHMYAQPNKKLNILIAEDNEINQMLITKMLAIEGFTYKVANNGYEAIELFKQEDFDVILMDVQMPKMDGLEATKEIRKLERGRDVPIIAITAYAMTDDSKKCLAAGMDYYLSKPLSYKKLFALINEIFDLDYKSTQAVNIQDRSLEKSNELVNSESIFIKLNSDLDFFNQITKKFESNSKNLINEIKIAIKENDYGKLKTTAHTIKGSIAVFEAKQAFELALKLENMGREEQTEGVDKVVYQLEKAISNIIETFNKFIENKMKQ